MVTQTTVIRMMSVSTMDNFTQMLAKMSEFEQHLEAKKPISESERVEYLKVLKENNNFLEQVLIGFGPTFPQ